MRVLFVVETASIHAARWINQLHGTGWDIHIFQAAWQNSRVCPEFKCGTMYLPRRTNGPQGVKIKITLPQNPVARKLFRFRPRLAELLHIRYLAWLIRKLKPDFIHSLGLHVNGNNLCLPVLSACRMLDKACKPPWIYSSWGSDLDFYAGECLEQRVEVEKVLSHCDYHLAECERDVRLAQEMGFQGKFKGFFPAFGGVPLEDFRKLRRSDSYCSRQTILLKGRDCTGGGDPVGRAMTAMKAFSLCQRELASHRIVIGQASQSVKDEAVVLSATTNLDIHVLPYLPYAALLRIVGASHLFIALTINDGLPASLVEAMSMGAFPIHSDLEPIREWIDNGENGLLVPPENPRAVASAIRQALNDDKLVEQAAEINDKIVREKLSRAVVRSRVIDMYIRIAKVG
jgi:glycosyltransferase involved in cell wall biosynthesis